MQEAVHRIQPFEMTRDLIAHARALGFQSINVDLIYGLPYPDRRALRAQPSSKLSRSIPTASPCSATPTCPGCASSRAPSPRTFPRAWRNSASSAPASKNFSAPATSTSAWTISRKPDDELAVAQRNRTLHRNFQGYTTKAGADLYGMGVSAISGMERSYAQNYRELPRYTEAVERRGIATMRGYRLSDDDLCAAP